MKNNLKVKTVDQQLVDLLVVDEQDSSVVKKAAVKKAAVKLTATRAVAKSELLIDSKEIRLSLLSKKSGDATFLQFFRSLKASNHLENLKQLAHDCEQDETAKELSQSISQLNTKIKQGKVSLPCFPHGGKFLLSRSGGKFDFSKIGTQDWSETTKSLLEQAKEDKAAALTAEREAVGEVFIRDFSEPIEKIKVLVGDLSEKDRKEVMSYLFSKYE